MPIPFQCGSCGKNYNAPDHLAGKRIKCRDCGAAVEVPVAEADPLASPDLLNSPDLLGMPPGPPAADPLRMPPPAPAANPLFYQGGPGMAASRSATPRPRPSGKTIALWIGGGVAGLLLLCCGGGGWWMYSSISAVMERARAQRGGMPTQREAYEHVLAESAPTSGGNAASAGAKQLKIPLDGVKWEVKPDPPPHMKPGTASKPIELKSAGAEPISFHFSDADIGQVAVFNVLANSEARPEDRFSQREKELMHLNRLYPGDPLTQPSWIDRYDLVDGRHLRRLDLPKGSVMQDLSPLGDRAIVKFQSSLQIWSLVDGTKLSEWSLGGWVSDGRVKPFAAFVNSDHVIARTGPAHIALWRVSDRKQVYLIDNVGCHFAKSLFERLSPNRKYLMTMTQGGGRAAQLVFIEALTGEVRGIVPASPMLGNDPAMWQGAAFRSDGQMAVIALQSGPKYAVTTIDLTQGKVVSRPGHFGEAVWAGKDHLYSSTGSLFDIQRELYVWRYSGATRAVVAQQAADGRIWFHTHADAPPTPYSSSLAPLLDPGGPKSPRWLAAIQLPTAEHLLEINAALAKTQPLVQRGSRVSLQVECDGPDGMNAKVTMALKKKLDSLGIGIAEGQPVRLVASAHVTKTESKQYKPFLNRDGQSPEYTINVTTVVCELKFVGSDDKPIWEQKVGLAPGDAGVLYAQSGDFQDQIAKLEQSHWPAAEQWLTSMPLPRQVYANFKPVGFHGLDFPGVIDRTPAASVATNPPPAAATTGTTAAAAPSTSAPPTRPGQPGSSPAQGPPAVAAGPASERDHRELVAKAYAEMLKSEADQVWNSLRYSSALGRPVLGVRWAVGTEMADQGGAGRDLDNFSNYSGKPMLDGLSLRAVRGDFGQFPTTGNPQTSRPVVVGMGTRGKLLTSAKRHALDLMLTAHVEVKSLGLNRRETSVTMRVLDVASGKQLWASEPLKQFNPIIGRQFTDYVLKHIDEAYPLKPLESVTAVTAAARIKALEAKEFAHPLVALAEVRYYQRKSLVSDEKAASHYQAILGVDDGRRFASGSEAERHALIEQWAAKMVDGS